MDNFYCLECLYAPEGADVAGSIPSGDDILSVYSKTVQFVDIDT